MPKKSRRVAARQAELSGRKKRTQHKGPAGVPPIREQVQLTRTGDEGAAQDAERPRQGAQPLPEVSRGAGVAAKAIAHRYVKAELLRIAAATGVIVLALVAASFFLR